MHIDNKKLFSNEYHFKTIRESFLERKSYLPKQTEGGLTKSQVDQFFKAFQIGKGVDLSKNLFAQNTVAEGKFHPYDKSVFNLTSITQQVFRFAEGGHKVLRGNFGIGKTWSHICLNYLSQIVLKCMLIDENLKQTKKLIEIYIEQFNQIHDPTLVAYKKSVQHILRQFQGFPIELFMEFKSDLTWTDLIKNFQSQFSEIPLSILHEFVEIQGETAFQTNLRKEFHYNYQRDQTKQFLNKMSKKINQYRMKYNKQMRFIINIDQANIYFGSIRKIISQIEKNINFNKKSVLNQDQKAQHTKVRKNIYDLHMHIQHLSNIMQVIYNSPMTTQIRLNCSDHAEVNIISQNAGLLDKYSLLYYNISSHSKSLVLDIDSGINATATAGEKELWAILWFQLQKYIFGINRDNLTEQIKLQDFRKILVQLQFRNNFNKIFVQSQQFAKSMRGKQQFQKNIKVKNKKKYLKVEPRSIDQRDLLNPHQYFSVRSSSLRLTFQNKLIHLEIIKLSQLINKYQAIKNNQIHGFGLQKLLKQLQKTQQEIKKSLTQLLKQFLIEGKSYDRNITLQRSHKLMIQNQTAYMQSKKTLFLFKLRDLIVRKYKQQKGLEMQKKFHKKIRLSFQDILDLNISMKKSIGQKNLNNANNIINDLMDSQYMKYQSGVFTITQSYYNFLQRLERTQVNHAFKTQYEIWFYYLNQKVDPIKFDNRMTLLLSSCSFKITFGKDQYTIANQNVVRYFKQFNGLGDNILKIKKRLRENLQLIEDELKSIKPGQTLGYQPSKISQQQYSTNSRWFDVILVQERGYQKDLIITIDFSLGQTVAIQDKIINIRTTFHTKVIKKNKDFLSRYDYQHWFICRYHVKKQLGISLAKVDKRIQVLLKQKLQKKELKLKAQQKTIQQKILELRELKLQPFIKIVSVNDISFQVNNVSPQLGLIVSVDLQKIKRQG